MVILKKSQLQSGLDEGPGGGGGGGEGTPLFGLSTKRLCYVPGACLCKDQFGIWGVVWPWQVILHRSWLQDTILLIGKLNALDQKQHFG